MNKFICTFGCGTPLAACVQPVSAETDEDARRAMRHFYADKWAFCYRIGDCQLKLQQFVALPTIEVHGDDIYVTQAEGLPAAAGAADAKPKFHYKVRVTRIQRLGRGRGREPGRGRVEGVRRGRREGEGRPVLVRRR